MELRFMGKTGLLVSELCLGAMTFGRETSEADSLRMMDMFADAGGNFIDTANVYSMGLSEQIVGKWLKTRQRQNFVIATKVRWSMGPDANAIGLSRKHILDSVDASLRRLGVDAIDLYQVHGWDNATPLEETLGTLNNLVQAGKVRYLGVSNYAGYQVQKAVDLANSRGWEPFTCLQPLYNLLDRSMEYELTPVCLAEGIGIIPWSPLRGGWLSGKYKRGAQSPVAGTRVEEAQAKGWSENWDSYANEHTWGVLDALHAVASETGKHPAQVALRWLLQRPGVTAPIIGARTLEHAKINLGATGWQLSESQMARLTKASDTPLPYPYGFMEGWKRR